MTSGELIGENEKVIGRYNVEIARYSAGRYVSTIPPILVTITDSRVILQPQTRKRYNPAIIPAGYIVNVQRVKADRGMVSITLKNDYRINLFVSFMYLQHFINHLRGIAELPPAKDFVLPLNMEQLSRLIQFFECY